MWSWVRAPRWVLLWSDVLGSTVSRHVTLSDGCCLSSTISPAPSAAPWTGVASQNRCWPHRWHEGARRSCSGLGRMQAALSRVCCASGMSLQRRPFQPEAAVITGRSCACCAFVTQPCSEARLAQPVERKALNLVVVGSSPMVGVAMERCPWQHREQTCHFV